jgi:hypothetical protein
MSRSYMELDAVASRPKVGLGVDASRSNMELDASRSNMAMDAIVSTPNMGLGGRGRVQA